jgi:DNA-binding SARP family transcriptional activator
LSVQLFGRFRAFWSGLEVTFDSRAARALLALVVVRPRPWARDAITTEIWPDAGYGPSARLRQALWLVRRSLARAGVDPADVLEVDDDRIGLRSGIGVHSDASQFVEFLRRRPPALEAALELYGGDFAEDLGLECLAARREQLADLYEDALATVARTRLGAGDLDGAQSVAASLLERDPLREEAHAVLIEVYGRTGSRSQVHRQYRRLSGVLAAELDAAPLPETRAAYLVALSTTTARSAGVAAVLTEESGLASAGYRSVTVS